MKTLSVCGLALLSFFYLDGSAQNKKPAATKKAPAASVQQAQPPQVLEVASPAPVEEGDNRVVFTVDGTPITVSEFLSVFNKNNSSKQAPSEKEIRDYLDLYIKFKYKVTEAYNLKLDTSDRFRGELDGYRTQLAQPYLNDKETTEELLKEAYERMKTEIRASHILVLCKENASPKDTLEAYKRIMALRDQIVKGGDFEKIAMESSEDPSAKENKGDLGYFSVFKMIYSFEDQCYKAKPGVVSMPFRTEVGYHIVLVKDVRPARGQIRVAHIMTMAREGSPDSITNEARRRIEEIQQRLKNGEKFEELAKKYSDDASSGDRGGELAWFSTGKMVPEFEDASFALKNNGDISGIIRTPYGFHIIKRIELQPVPKFEDVKADLQTKIARDSRSYKNRQVKIAKLKSEYRFTENLPVKKEALSKIDTTYFTLAWKRGKLDNDKKTLFTVGTKAVTVADFGKYLDENQVEMKEVSLPIFMEKAYNNFVERQVLAYEDSRLETKYPDFRNLIREYREGILLFDLSDQMVWSKAVSDTAGLKAYYEAHKSENNWGARVNGVIYQFSDEKTAKAALKDMKKGKLTAEEILAKYNANNALAGKATTGKFEKGDNAVVDTIEWKNGFSKIVFVNGQYSFVDVRGVLPAGPKELGEVRGIMTTNYQNYLEAAWLESLKKKYIVKVNEDVVKSLYAH